MGQNVHFHTDTFILLLKFRYKAGKYTRHSCNGLQRTPINTADKKMEEIKKYKVLTVFVGIYCPLKSFYICSQPENNQNLLSLPNSQGCIWRYLCFDWLRQYNATLDYQDLLRNVTCSQSSACLPHSNSNQHVQSCPSLRTCKRQ